MDNNRGKWAPYPPDGWWQRVDCPVHGSSLAVEEIPSDTEEKNTVNGIWGD
jgi:hypothetical protein